LFERVSCVGVVAAAVAVVVAAAAAAAAIALVGELVVACYIDTQVLDTVRRSTAAVRVILRKEEKEEKITLNMQ
jgi:DNA topoisomerase IB